MATNEKPTGNLLTEVHAARGRTSAEFLLEYLPRDADLLDVGSGPGTITVDIASSLYAGSVVGVDLDPERVRSSTGLAQRKGVENVRFEVSDAYALPFSDNSFDAVFCHTVLLHLTDPLRAIREMTRVVKTSGLVGVSDTDHDGLIIAPMDPDMMEGIHFHYEWKADRGGSYFIGKHLKPLMREAGLTDLVFSAMNRTFSTPEEVATFARQGNRFHSNPDCHAYAGEVGITDYAERASRWERGAEQWSHHPDAFVVMLQCQVVGRKP